MNNENNFKKLTPFKMQVLQSFPFIDEDFDAITNYELLCKVVEYLNKTVSNVDLLNEKVEEFQHYFDNLDVQEEINKKLDDMVNSGELQELISNIFNDINIKIDNDYNQLDNKINSVASGAPAGVYETESALISADPDHSKIYVVSDTGKWFYYDTSTNLWTSGGIYQTPVNLDLVTTMIDNISDLEKTIYGKDYIVNTNQFSDGALVSDTPVITYTSDNKYKCVLLTLNDLIGGVKINYNPPIGQNLLLFRNVFDENNHYVARGWAIVSSSNDYIDTSANINRWIGLGGVKIGYTFAYSTTTAPANIVTLPNNFDVRLYKEETNSLINKIIVVDSNGSGNYTSVIEAVNNEPENTIIIIKPGVYEGTIQAFTKRIILIGTDKNKCILRSTDGQYEYPAINMSCGYLQNLTIKSEYINGTSNEINSETNGAYAIHCENEYGVGKELEINNCVLSSDFESALGVGLRKNFKLTINNCTLINNQINGRGKYSDVGGLGALYFHDSIGEQGEQYIEVKNCILQSNLGYSMVPYKVSNNNNIVNYSFIFNVLYDKINGYNNNIWNRNDAIGSAMFKKGICYGNSNDLIN